MTTLTHDFLFAKTDDKPKEKDKLPPMVNEPNQDAIDAETARRLREAAEERRRQQQQTNKGHGAWGKGAGNADAGNWEDSQSGVTALSCPMPLASCPSPSLVAQLRAGYANDNPLCFCQCGKFCPAADACLPVRGEIHQPYWTLREAATPRGRGWAACLYDPQAERFLVHTLYSRLYPTPCAAADTLLAHALKSRQHPIRLDHGQFCQVDLSGVEARMAQALYGAGYALFLDHEEAPDLRHPLMVAGYRAALVDAEVAINEQNPGFVWELDTLPVVAVSWNSATADDYVPFQHPKERYASVRDERDRDDYVGV